MKIIILGPAYPLRGGIANFNEALCRELNQMGHSCSIVSFSLQYPGFLFPGTTQLAKDDPAPEGLKIETMLNSVNPVSWIKTAHHIKRHNPDLLIVRFWLPFMGPALGTVIRLVRKNSKTHVAAITDNVIPHEKRLFDHSFTRWFLSGCDSFTTMTQSVAQDLADFDVTGSVTVSPHPVYDIFGSPVDSQAARLQLGIQPNQKLVLFFGFIRKYKGLDLLIRAIADTKLRSMDVKLVVAGEFYEDSKPYLDLIQELGLGQQVILHDHYIPKDQVKTYFAAADIVAQPYRTATQSGVTQIAYHFGKTMLVTNVGGLPEMVPEGKAGYVTPPEPEPIARALDDYFSNNRKAEMERFVSMHKSAFTWSGFASALLRNAGF
ncbi:MAG: glycosyltransferase [Arcticibacter sp.]